VAFAAAEAAAREVPAGQVEQHLEQELQDQDQDMKQYFPDQDLFDFESELDDEEEEEDLDPEEKRRRWDEHNFPGYDFGDLNDKRNSELRQKKYEELIEANKQKHAENRLRNSPKAFRRRKLWFEYKALRAEKIKKEAKRIRKEMKKRVVSKPLSELQAGDRLNGTVRNVEKFGAFVHVGAEKDGLLHIKDMCSAQWVSKADEVFKSGDEVSVQVKFVDAEKRLLGLTMKELDDQGMPMIPEEVASALANLDRQSLKNLEEDDQVWGVVERVTSFGAFVDIGAEVQAFLHILDYPRRVKAASATKSFHRGQRLRLYVKEVELDKNRVKVTAERPEWLPMVW